MAWDLYTLGEVVELKTWKKIAIALGVAGAAYLGGHVVHHIDKVRAIDRMLVELPEGASVLNVGCKNWSIFADRLSKFSVTNIDAVQREVPNFVLADVRDLSIFDDGTFSGILCSHVLEHIPREHVGVAISEMRRVCKDPSKIYVVLPRWYLPTTWMDLEHQWIPIGQTMVPSPIRSIETLISQTSG